jgi:pimeloyl-ACP methyl ester carboxylesterase
MNQIELSADTIEYQDTGAGPPLVFLHSLLMAQDSRSCGGHGAVCPFMGHAVPCML